MKSKFEAGSMFGTLTIKALSHRDKWKKRVFDCLCACGMKVKVSESNLQRKNRKGCDSCYRKNNHKLRYTRIYQTWSDMKSRCVNPNNPGFHLYGGKGIRVADEWHDFMTFRAWAMENGYTENLVIDRIDSSQGYNPSNCRWVTKRENAMNKFGVDLEKTCKHGHPWKSETTYTWGVNHRQCKICSDARRLKKYYANRKISAEEWKK